MPHPGSSTQPLRIAIIGSGPAACYAADALFKQAELAVEVDMFDRLPTPYGLVRAGVAPDHPKIKSVTRIFDHMARNPGFRFYGGVEYGTHIGLADLQDHYHQILFATGAQTDRRMNIPGEDLLGSCPATAFVAWYNGHPDFVNCPVDLSSERVAIVGVGNVAVDVARILCSTPEELAQTDIAPYALDALRHSGIREVHLLGRRGPAQAAFTNPEIKELGELADADVIVRADEAELDAHSAATLQSSGDKATIRKVEILQDYARRAPAGKRRRLVIRFLVSPVELLGDAAGHVVTLRLVRNVLRASESGTLSPEATDQFEELPVGVVFRSVGYRGVALPGVPFNDRWGVIYNQKGRVLDPTTQQPITGWYTSGWIKRGPSGVIGTNKVDSVETVTCMLEDLAQGRVIPCPHPEAAHMEALVRERQPDFFSFNDWLRLDAIEVARGQANGAPRVKFTSIADMQAALGR
jgi:ferredoxin--NADP+ reductase